MVIELPDATTRWRCAGCGNLTRFDVIRQSRRSEYWHFDLSGEPAIEEASTLAEHVVEVTCRWCGRDDSVEVVARPAAGGDGG
ncbi:MAG: hypothetical protein GEU93_16985 [Propionibacteriales bacterium]|nr:hypothetical protein [Propionibacteriales bacterium]